MVAYTNNFRLMMLLTLCALPLIALLRRGPRLSTREAEVVTLE
jgi:hypothetical protein